MFLLDFKLTLEGFITLKRVYVNFQNTNYKQLYTQGEKNYEYD